MLLCILLRVVYIGTENGSIQGAATCWSCSPPLCVSPPSTVLSSLLQVRQTLTLSWERQLLQIIAVIVFGASVGRLVDTMGRISAARLSLAIQVSSSPTQLYRSLLLNREFKDWHLQWGNGFNRLLGIGWKDLDDLFGRPPWNFNSNKMVKKSALWHVCTRKIHNTLKADFCLFAYFGPD